MDDNTLTILRNVLARHGTELLDDEERCENVLNENFPVDAGVKVRGLMAALEYGVPKRLIGMPAASLTSAAINNYAASVAAAMGLQGDLAHWAVVAWAFALGLPIVDGATGQSRDGQAAQPAAERKPDAGAANAAAVMPAKAAGPLPFLRKLSRRQLAWAGGGLAALLIVVLIVNSQDGTNGSPSAAGNSWSKFANAKFGTTVEYPSWFVSTPTLGDSADDNGFSAYYKGPDGATLEIGAALNTGHHTAADILEKMPNVLNGEGVKITKKASGDRWLQVLGTADDQTFYYEYDVLSRQGTILNLFILRCPADRGNAVYNDVVTRMAQSFIDNNP